jgi:hypothetical protein
VHAAQLDLLRGRVEPEVAWEEGAAVVCPECRKEWCAARSRAGAGVAAPECDAVPHRDQSAGAALPLPGAWGQNCAHAVGGTGFVFYAALRCTTLHFEAFAVQLIDACRSLSEVAELLELDLDGVPRLVERAVTAVWRGVRWRKSAGSGSTKKFSARTKLLLTCNVK